jgi:hypothetical protein
MHATKYCHVFSDYRRGIGLTAGFIGSQSVTQLGYIVLHFTTHTTQSPLTLSTTTDDSSLAHNSWHHLPSIALHFTDNFNRTVALTLN